MSDKPLVSVIVTVYNKEKYIEECIKSIQKQTLKNIEILCVNDGSEDSSIELIEKIAKNDARIKIVSQANMGLVEARKTGVRNAEADYIGFIDADDWIDADMYQTMYEKMTEERVDFVSTGIFHSSGNVGYDLLDDGLYVGEGLDKLLSKMMWLDEYKTFGMKPNSVSKLYRRDILISSISGIDSRIRRNEDAALVYPYLLRVKSAYILHKAFYHVRWVDNSHSRSTDELYFERANAFYQYMDRAIKKSGMSRNLMPQLDRYAVQNLIVGINRNFGISDHIDVKFPYGKICGDVRVAIYGAGSYGKQIIKGIERGNQRGEMVKIVGIADRDINKVCMGYKAMSLEDLLNIEYDYIIIAIQSIQEAENIYNVLLKHGIDEDIIIKNTAFYA